MKLIVGLGNPGASYQNTRHNIGFIVLDRLAGKLGTEFAREKFRAQIAEGRRGTEKVLLLKPMTFMNKSGESVALAARNNLNDPADLLIIYDDAELPLGRLRIRAQGSAGSHNGMKSVIERVGTKDFPRLRIGVGRGKGSADLADHVLTKFVPDERDAVEKMLDRAVDAVLLWVESGTETAMNEYNKVINEDG